MDLTDSNAITIEFSSPTGPGGVLLLLQALEKRLMGKTPKHSMSRASSVMSVEGRYGLILKYQAIHVQYPIQVFLGLGSGSVTQNCPYYL